MMGIVEGFYGPMWDWIDRITMVEFMGRIELDTYIYGPKWDPYHRQWWRSPYPQNFVESFSMFVDAAKRYGVEVCFALSPGLDIDYSSPHDIALLVRKFEYFMELGIECIALFLDDIPPVLRGKGFRSLAEAQAALVNHVYRELRPRTMVFCPTFYYDVVEDYMKQIGSLLDPEIHIMWTGPRVCSHRIDCSDLERITNVFGRKPFIWDNYPVNDYFTCRGIVRLHIGPIRNRCPELAKLVSGYTANPANQVEVSKIVLFTVAQMLRNHSYDPDKALRDAVAYIVNKSARHWFERFVEFNKASFLNLEEETIDRNNADEVLEIAKNLRETLRNLRLLKEIEPVLNKMESIARYAKGERVELSYRIQTAGEYNPPIPDHRMVNELFGIVARRIPWYAEAYPKVCWW